MNGKIRYLLIILTSISLLTYGQNNHLSIGMNSNGICLGNAKNYNGIKLNLWDTNGETFNGLNFSFLSSSQYANGVRLSILMSDDSICNGLSVGCLAASAYRMNGIAIAGLAVLAKKKINGLGISGFGISADTMNGVFISIIGSTNFTHSNPRLISRVNGVSIGLLCGVNCEEFKGLAIGFNNVTKIHKGVTIGCINKSAELHGIQFGFWNVANNNRVFKKTPLINFNFKASKK